MKKLKEDIQINDYYMKTLENYEVKLNRTVEYNYNCRYDIFSYSNSMCRAKLFDDSNVDFEHEFAPKSNFANKRFKKVFENFY